MAGCPHTCPSMPGGFPLTGQELSNLATAAVLASTSSAACATIDERQADAQAAKSPPRVDIAYHVLPEVVSCDPATLAEEVLVPYTSNLPMGTMSRRLLVSPDAEYPRELASDDAPRVNTVPPRRRRLPLSQLWPDTQNDHDAPGVADTSMDGPSSARYDSPWEWDSDGEDATSTVRPASTHSPEHGIQSTSATSASDGRSSPLPPTTGNSSFSASLLPSALSGEEGESDGAEDDTLRLLSPVSATRVVCNAAESVSESVSSSILAPDTDSLASVLLQHNSMRQDSCHDVDGEHGDSESLPRPAGFPALDVSFGAVLGLDMDGEFEVIRQRDDSSVEDLARGLFPALLYVIVSEDEYPASEEGVEGERLFGVRGGGEVENDGEDKYPEEDRDEGAADGEQEPQEIGIQKVVDDKHQGLCAGGYGNVVNGVPASDQEEEEERRFEDGVDGEQEPDSEEIAIKKAVDKGAEKHLCAKGHVNGVHGSRVLRLETIAEGMEDAVEMLNRENEEAEVDAEEKQHIDADAGGKLELEEPEEKWDFESDTSLSSSGSESSLSSSSISAPSPKTIISMLTEPPSVAVPQTQQQPKPSREPAPALSPLVLSPVLPELPAPTESFADAVLSSPEFRRAGAPLPGADAAPPVAAPVQPGPDPGPQRRRPRARTIGVTGDAAGGHERSDHDHAPTLAQLALPALSAEFLASLAQSTGDGSGRPGVAAGSVLWAPHDVRYTSDPRGKGKRPGADRKPGTSRHRRAHTVSEGGGRARRRMLVPAPRPAPAVVDHAWAIGVGEAVPWSPTRFGLFGAGVGLEDVDIL